MNRSFDHKTHGKPSPICEGLSELVNNSFGNTAEQILLNNYTHRCFESKEKKLKYWNLKNTPTISSRAGSVVKTVTVPFKMQRFLLAQPRVEITRNKTAINKS